MSIVIDALVKEIEKAYADIAVDKAAYEKHILPIRKFLSQKIQELEAVRLGELEKTAQIVCKIGDKMRFIGASSEELKTGDVVSLFAFMWGNDIYALPSVILENDGKHYKRSLGSILPLEAVEAEVHEIKEQMVILQQRLEDIGTDTERLKRSSLRQRDITDLGDV